MRVFADTNVVVRFLVMDDARQFAAVQRRVRAARKAGTEIVVPTVVLAEASWVLARAYGHSRREIADALDALVNARPFVAEDPSLVATALAMSKTGGADVADYLILARAQRDGSPLISFDERLRREVGVERP